MKLVSLLNVNGDVNSNTWPKANDMTNFITNYSQNKSGKVIGLIILSSTTMKPRLMNYHRLNRWKQALFTEKETAKADIYSWTSIIEWAREHPCQ